MKTTVKLTCEHCKQEFIREKRWAKKHVHSFCSPECGHNAKKLTHDLLCAECGTNIVRMNKEVKKSKSGNSFCGRSCAASYNNRLKKKSRRSRCEQKLLELLQTHFPSLRFEPNDKIMLDGLEIDIAIPDLNIGIEWNGIVHFKPIYGQTKLTRIQKIDAEKTKRATDKGIDLIVIPDLVSTDAMIKRAFKEIVPIIETTEKLVASQEFKP